MSWTPPPPPKEQREWICPFCEALNSACEKKCATCAAPKEKSQVSLQVERKEMLTMLRSVEEVNPLIMEARCDEEEKQ